MGPGTGGYQQERETDPAGADADVLDRVASLAARLTRAPTAVVGVWTDGGFSVSGRVDAPDRGAEPLHRALLRRGAAGAFAVGDLRAAAGDADDALLREHGIVAAAGVPILRDATLLGVVCVADTQARDWARDDLDALADVAAVAGALLHARGERPETLGSPDRYRSVVAAMSEGVVMQRADGEIVACNEAAERILGLSADQMMGRTSADPRWRAVDTEGRDLPGTEHPAMVSLRTGRPVRDAIMGVETPEMPRRWISVCTQPVRAADGTVSAVVATFRDVTRERDDQQRLAAHAREQDALRDLATLVASEAPPRRVFDVAAEHMVRVLGGTSGGVVRLEAGGGARLVGAFAPEGFPTPPIGELIDTTLASATMRAIKTGKPARVVHNGTPGMTAVQGTALAVPITVNGRMWGVASVLGSTSVSSEERAFERLGRFVDLVELAVVGADAREQLSRLATVDDLTGLYNQRWFGERLEEEVQRAVRASSPLSLVLFDLDTFKQVNDTYGHETGNEVLAEFGRRMLDQARSGEIVARVGGEEFVWILPGADADAAFRAAERARQAIAAEPFARVGTLTASAGVSSLDAAGGDARALFRCADAAMYAAKQAGRNATRRYEPGTPMRRD